MISSPRYPVTTFARWASLDDFLAGRPPIRHTSVSYSTRLAFAKKGRETAEKNMEFQTKLAQENQAKKEAEFQKAEPFVQRLESTKPGELSDLSEAQLASDLRNIWDTYGRGMRSAYRTLAYRGLDSAPTGAEASILNTALRDRGAAETEAYNRALERTYGQGLQALQYRTGMQQLYDPLAPSEAAVKSAAYRSQMGSTLGDIGQGLSAGVGLATGLGALGTFGKGFQQSALGALGRSEY